MYFLSFLFVCGAFAHSIFYFIEGNGNPPQYSCLEIPWTEEPDGLQTGGCKESDVTEHTHIPVRDMVPYPCGYQEDKQETSWTPIQSKQKI